MKNISCSFTGHRPSRFSFRYNETDDRCLNLKTIITQQIRILITMGVKVFYSGFALGTDLWASDSVLELKEEYPDIKLIAVLPCKTQPDRWSEKQKKRYFDTLTLCDEVTTISENYTRTCMFERNRYLVDHSDYLLAVFDGKESGGTYYTVNYGIKKGCKIITIHPDTLICTESSKHIT